MVIAVTDILAWNLVVYVKYNEKNYLATNTCDLA
jgi:hypothetical protein